VHITLVELHEFDDLKDQVPVLTDKGEKIIDRTPPKQFGEYRKLVIADETWFVHCSFAGALDFVFRALGEGNITIDEESGEGELVVPRTRRAAGLAIREALLASSSTCSALTTYTSRESETGERDDRRPHHARRFF